MVENKIYLFFGVNILTIPFTFFALNSLLSIEYQGIESSNSYLIILIISVLPFYFLSFILFFYVIPKLIEYILLLIPILLVLNASFIYLIRDIKIDNYLYQFFIFVLPAYFFGIILSRRGFIISASNFFLYASLLSTISALFLIPKILLIPTRELITFFGGGHYQSFSYALAFAYLIFLTNFLFYYRKKNIYFSAGYILAFITQIFSVILSGGRGGIGVIIIGTGILFLYRYSLVKVLKKMIRIILLSSLISLLFLWYFNDYSERIFESFGRLFSFISIDGFDFEQTSNRNIVYTETINLIVKSPLYGYGFLGNLKITNGGYPHNLFLEILLQGGIIFLSFWLFFLGYILKKLHFLVRSGNNHKFILAIFIYSFVQLLFSGTYRLEPFFWFSISYILNVSEKTNV